MNRILPQGLTEAHMHGRNNLIWYGLALEDFKAVIIEVQSASLA